MRRGGDGSRALIGRLDRRMLLWICVIMLFAVALGLSLPNLSTAIQGRRIDRTNELVDLGAGALSLNSDEMKLERLRLLGSFSRESSNDAAFAQYIEISSGRFMDEAGAGAMLPKVLALTQGTGLACTDFNESDYSYSTPALLVSEDYVGSTIIWIVNYSRDDGYNIYDLSYCVDDATGIILGAAYYIGRYGGVVEENASSQPDTRESLERLVLNLSESYDLSDTQLRLADIDTGVEAQEAPRLYNSFYSNYWIDFIKDGQTVYSMPVALSIDSWAINAQA